MSTDTAATGPWREKIYEVIFEADTPMGKAFDVALLWAILGSVSAVCLDSVASFEERFHNVFSAAEWIFTALFSVEYLLRMISVRQPLR